MSGVYRNAPEILTLTTSYLTLTTSYHAQKYMILIGYEKTYKCPECSNTNIKTDFRKKERYCSHCGLIVQDMTLLTLKQKEYIAKIMGHKS